MIELFAALLPLAAASGWWAAQRSIAKKYNNTQARLSSDYYRGLNYLLNEEQDKAFEVFLRLVQTDSDTIETHLALGGLFRRRGEVERAIRIHQNLLARPSLEQSQRGLVLLELGRDYMHAGLLDRAESVFVELTQQRPQQTEALRHLLAIYQREHEWQKAITVAGQLSADDGQDAKLIIAHCYCEMALLHLRHNETANSVSALKNALATDPKSVRANMLLGRIYQQQRQYTTALRHYLRIFAVDEEFIPEVLPDVIGCIEQGAPSDELDHYIRVLAKDEKHAILAPGIARYLYHTKGLAEAQRYLDQQLQRGPSLQGLIEWAELQQLAQRSDGRLQRVIEVLQRVIQQLPGYQCRQCGYNSSSLQWQCPACHTWGTLKPLIRSLAY